MPGSGKAGFSGKSPGTPQLPAVGGVFRRVLCGLHPAAFRRCFNATLEVEGAVIAGQTTTEHSGPEKTHLAISRWTLKDNRNNSKPLEPCI